MIIFCGQGTTSVANRALQQRLGMQQRPEAHCQAALAAAGRVRAVGGGKGMLCRPELRLNHRSSFTCQMVKISGELL
jgi:hypothetical protein